MIDPYCERIKFLVEYFIFMTRKKSKFYAKMFGFFLGIRMSEQYYASDNDDDLARIGGRGGDEERCTAPPSTTTTTTATAGGGGPTSILMPRSGASVDEVGDCCTATMPTVHEQHESNGADDGRLANGAVAKGFWRTFSL